MTKPFISRTFEIDGQKALCLFFQPESDRGDFRCDYEIDMLHIKITRHAFGVDGIQALLLAMKSAHLHLLMARRDDGVKVSWLDQDNLSLPIMENVADLAPDNAY